MSPSDDISSSPTTGPAQDKVIIDPSRGGQVEAHESGDGSRALTVREGEWVWEGVRSVLEVDLFRCVLSSLGDLLLIQCQ